MNKEKRWFYLGVGTLLLIFCGLIYGWSLFKAPFHEIYPQWTLPQLSMTFTISMIFFCIGGFTAGKLSAKLSPKAIIMLAAVFLLIGFTGVSCMKPEDSSVSLIMLYICYGVLGGYGVGLTYNCVISTINRWFPDKSGLASGIMMMGFGLGALILGSVATELIVSKGIFSTFFILGILIFTFLILGSFIIKQPVIFAGEQYTSSETFYGEGPFCMLKTVSFWLFMLWCVVVNIGGLMVINSAASISVAFGAPAIVGMIVSVFNGAGRVIVGSIYDKKGGRVAMVVDMIFMFAGGIALLAGAKSTNVLLILAGLLSMGLCYGGNPTICSTFINKYYGPKYFSVNFGIGMFNLVPAAMIGPLVGSALVEKSGGSYDSNFIAILFCAGFALALWMLLSIWVKKENAQRENARPF